jgi:hypothetical protein
MFRRSILHAAAWCSSYFTAEVAGGVAPQPPARDGLMGGFLGECRMLGTRDYAPLLAVPQALDFFDRVDRSCGDAIG